MNDTPCCPECSGEIARDGDETVCTDCGLVVAADRIDRGPEWRSFADDETNRERTGAPLTRSRHDRGLSTEIGRGDSSVRATGRKRRRLARMRREHNRAQIATKAERNQVYAFTEIRRLVAALDLPRDVREQSCVLFDSAQSADLLQGRSLEGFAAATVYATCRTRSIARTIDEIVADARADENELRAAYDALNRELGLPTGPIDPGEYVPRFATELDLPDRVERRALELARRGHEAGISCGRDPSGFAAGCLYKAAQDCGHGLNQAEAAEVADVSPVTLRKAFYDVREELAAGCEGDDAGSDDPEAGTDSATGATAATADDTASGDDAATGDEESISSTDEVPVAPDATDRDAVLCDDSVENSSSAVVLGDAD